VPENPTQKLFLQKPLVNLRLHHTKNPLFDLIVIPHNSSSNSGRRVEQRDTIFLITAIILEDNTSLNIPANA
jgi:hypothetical protein